jgi:signal transduction histidine kinase
MLALPLAVAAGAAMAQGSARWAVAGVLLALGALGLGWPRSRPPASPEPPAPPPAPDALLCLQMQLELLPACAWALRGGSLQPLTQRARRLLAPGGVQDGDHLAQQLRERAASGQAGQISLDLERGSERWSLALQPLNLAGEAQTLITLVPLESALETERLAAWQQLVQVLTHEIMNSLTPISSLSQSARTLLDEPDTRAELHLALDAIAQRAAGLQRFVADYRRISQLPKPQPSAVDVAALLERLRAAVAPAWAARGGGAQFRCEHPGLRLLADPAQLEQALLSLIDNATQATRDTDAPQLWVEARLSRGGRLRIAVRDNGPGVPPGLEQQIFLPFFSATPGGSGIGLTLARQLVHGMGGRLRHARPLRNAGGSGGAEFVISF